MNKSVIVYGPQGCGKTRWADRIAKNFGLDVIVDDWGCSVFSPHCTLYLTNNEEDVQLWKDEAICLSFATVAEMINQGIPRTQWFGANDRPVHRGIYECDREEVFPKRGRVTRRLAYCGNDNWEYAEDTGHHVPGDCASFDIFDYWRGLAEEPIVIPEAA